MAPVSNVTRIGQSRFWLLVFSLAFLGSGNWAATGYKHGANTLLARAHALIPECVQVSHGTRLSSAFKQLESIAADSKEPLIEAYDVLLDLILANAKPTDGRCNGDYVELAYKVLELEQKSATENGSSLDAGDKLQELKERFHPGVFKLFDETVRFVVTAPGNLTAGYALYSKQRHGTNFATSMMRQFDSRLPAFYWNLVSTNEIDRSRNEFNFVNVASNWTKFRFPRSEAHLRLIPTSKSLLNPESKLFRFRLMEQSSDSWRNPVFYRVRVDGPKSITAPPNDKLLMLESVSKLKDGSRFMLTGMENVISEKSTNFSEDVRSLYPPCRNEKDLLDQYRLYDFLQIYNNKTESAVRLREAYEALLDEIIGSPFLCGQDYVQIAYHVLQRCGDGNATGDDAEQQAWNDFKGRFNPGVFDLFDQQKRWVMVSADEPGYAIDFTFKGKRKIRKPWDKRQIDCAAQYNPEVGGRYFTVLPVIYEIRNQTLPENMKMLLLPTPESVIPAAKDFRFWLVVTGKVFVTRNILAEDGYLSEKYNQEPEECRKRYVANLNCSAIFYFEDADWRYSAGLSSVEEARNWYLPCEDEINLFDDWRLWTFFQAFNAESVSNSSVLVAAYHAMFDAITTNSPLVCSQDYVQLAFKVQQIQQSLNSTEEDQENWARLRSRFNPKVFDFFNENKTWKIASVESPNYAIFGNDRYTGDDEDPLRIKLQLLKVDSRFPAFNWLFQTLNEGRALGLKSYSGLPFQPFESLYYRSKLYEQFKQQIVPTASSLDPNSTVFQFNIVDVFQRRAYTFENVVYTSYWNRLKDLVPAGFLEDKNKTFVITHDDELSNSALFFLEPVDETAPSTKVSVASQIKELFPLCETQRDKFTLDRLWDVVQVFHLDVANSSILVEAYEATLEAILAPSPFNCTADYVQLANQVYELEKKLNRTNASEDQLNEFERLKNRFNPGVFKLFDDHQMYRIMSVDQPGYAVCALELHSTSSIEADLNGFEANKLDLTRLPTNESSVTTEPAKWYFQRLSRGNSFLLLKEDTRKPWNKVVVVPTASTLDPMAPTFEFELQYINYSYSYARKILTVVESKSLGQSSTEETANFNLYDYGFDDFGGNIAKFKLEHA